MNISIRQKEIITGSVVLFLSFGSLFLAEATIRIKQMNVFGTVADVERSSNYFIDKERDLRIPVPGSKHGTLQFNEFGFRSPEIALVKPPNVVRIAFLGHSTTLDPYVLSLERTWPHIVSKIIDESLPGPKVEYINAGVPGMGSKKVHVYYEHYVKKLSPDIVVISVNDQNRDLDDQVRATGLFSDIHYQPSWLARHSHFWAKVEKNAVVLQRQRAAFQETGRLQVDTAALTKNFHERISDLIGAIYASSAQPVLLNYDNMLRPNQERDEQRRAAQTLLYFMPYMSIPRILAVQSAYNDTLEKVARETGTPIMDWRNSVPGNSEHFTDSVHFTAKGSRLMANHLAKLMLQNPLIRRRIVEVTRQKVN